MMKDRPLWTPLLYVTFACISLAPGPVTANVVDAESNVSQPSIDKDGTVHVTDFTMPFSSLASDEAKKRFIESSMQTGTSKTSTPPALEDVSTTEGLSIYILKLRGEVDGAQKEALLEMLRTFPVNITGESMGGVRTAVVMPQDGVSSSNRDRVLINLHGGGMMFGGRYDGPTESAPIASIGKIKVVTVDYRMAPEYRFPAASEDVAAVYGALLKRYKPENIGIYGCSSGGYLAAQAAAWFQVHGLPRPGALAILCSAAGRNVEGDSYYLPSGAWARNERFQLARALYYASGVKPRDPLVWPMYSPAVLAKFPPTAFLNATRDNTMSGAIYSHMQLVKAGVDAELYLWDGLGHGFMLDASLPESREAYDVVVRFFERHLGASARAPHK